jgi:hypothetical protein
MQEPRDGKAQDGEEKEVIEKGVAVRMVEKGALARLTAILADTCRAKAQKDYSATDLLVFANWAKTALNVDIEDKEAFHEQLLKEVSAFTYKARRVFLYDAALDRLDQIGG